MSRSLYGIDEYSRFVERDGERYFIEAFPYWGWHPAYLWHHARARFGIVVWYAHRITRQRWLGYSPVGNP
jgi:hypothetical protein